MARQRDYAAEYAARQERAREHGFQTYTEERRFRESTRFEREIAGLSEEWRNLHPGNYRTANPVELAAFYRMVVEPSSTGRVTGEERRLAVAYFIEYEDYSEQEAIEAMRSLYGMSP